MDNVEKAVADNFANWREENGRNGISEKEILEDMATYMNEAFQINNIESSEAANIVDILNTMVASDVDNSVGLNGVRENVIACAATEHEESDPGVTESRSSRRTRNAEEKLETTTSTTTTTTTQSQQPPQPQNHSRLNRKPSKLKKLQ